MRRIEEMLGDLGDGTHVVEVTAESGASGTRLLAEIARLARAGQIRVSSAGLPSLAGGPLVIVLDLPATSIPVPDRRSGTSGPENEVDDPARGPGRPAAVRPRRGQRRAGRPLPAALTNRERQVAELAGEGLTNREIAAALFVTEKTVEMHLTHVFAKLDVRNRVGLARRLHATGRGE
ncbi:helix-turn-helix transcriptional regulator [Plantactinospora sp. WMMC1484]|uniref:helix-turn-helix transcriptional regulator n=1 Tax=Plantactinospora sp. WMMC1484 TaxID=3404122 RepID=UPI003BF48135